VEIGQIYALIRQRGVNSAEVTVRAGR
jgi:hypothetical protein